MERRWYRYFFKKSLHHYLETVMMEKIFCCLSSYSKKTPTSKVGDELRLLPT